jgi:hypothetical protein
LQQYQDKELTCVECGATFIHSADDQQAFAERGYTNEPKRCMACRDARRGSRGSFGGGFGAVKCIPQCVPSVAKTLRCLLSRRKGALSTAANVTSYSVAIGRASDRQALKLT